MCVQPLALLPPPFPSSSPLLLYIDALAVGEAHRRLGNASRLLEAVDKLGAHLQDRLCICTRLVCMYCV